VGLLIESVTCCFQFVVFFFWLFVCPSCLLFLYLLPLNNTMISTTTIHPFINLNFVFDIEEGNEFSSQTQVTNGSQEVYNLEIYIAWEFSFQSYW